MPETRAISERIDLSYVKRKHWPQSAMFRWAVTLCGAVLIGAGALEVGHATETFPAHAYYTSGTIAKAHSMFASNCAACHASDPANPQAVSFALPVSDEKCLDCHETYAVTHHPKQRLYNGRERKVDGYAAPVVMSSNCASCHVDHQGYDHDLNRVSDRVCVQCHEDLAAKGYAPGKGAPAVSCILRGVTDVLPAREGARQ